MSARRILQSVLAIVGGYLGNAILVAATEQLLLKLAPRPAFFFLDLLSQCVCGVAGACLCCLISEERERLLAAIVFNGLGLVLGAISIVTSWNQEPHWYGIGLLCVWTPCTWTGYIFARHLIGRARLASPTIR